MDVGNVVRQQQLDEEVATGAILDKNGDPFLAADRKECTVSVLGRHSAAYRRARDQVERRALGRRRKKATPADLMEDRIALAASVVVAWYGWTKDGQTFPCTPENVRYLMQASELFLEQVEELIDGHADFFKKSSTTSPSV